MKRYLSTRYNDNAWSFGLLILRVAAGALMLYYGYDKLTHFADKAKGMNQIFGSPIDGALVVFAEFFCSALLILGLFTRFALIPLIVTMCVAFFKVNGGHFFKDETTVNSAFFFLIIFITLLFTGPGKFSVDKMIAK